MIRVCTLHFGYRDYFVESIRFGESYCARHGYSWHILGGVQYPDARDLRWSKVPGVCEVLSMPETDFVFYIDADAMVARSSDSLKLLTDMIGGKDILIGEDWPRHINTGVWLAKPNAIDILKFWEMTPTLDASLGHRWPVDEAGFIEHVEPRYRDRIVVKKRSELNLVNGFVYHQMTGAPRVKQSRLAVYNRFFRV